MLELGLGCGNDLEMYKINLQQAFISLRGGIWLHQMFTESPRCLECPLSILVAHMTVMASGESDDTLGEVE